MVVDIAKRTQERAIEFLSVKDELELTARMLGIPLLVRPWWGSARQHSLGEDLRRTGPLKWICPSGFNYAGKKYPEIQKGKIILWEGPCKSKKHTHSQEIEMRGTNIDPPTMLITIRTLKSLAVNYLLGMDEGSPYFVPVGREVETVNEAFFWLMPKPVKLAVAQGLKVVRQGDWYFYPSKHPPRRVKNDSGYTEFPVLRYWRGIIYKNVPLIDENVLTRHRAEEASYMSAKVLVRGRITAPNHQPLFLEGWHLAIRNRGLQGRDSNAVHVFGDRIVRPQDRTWSD